MPRAASRITLEITDVRVEPLQNITEGDAQEEGILMGETLGYYGALPDFIALWDALYAKKGYGWDTNPWVWVLSFKKINEGEIENHR
jgi:hypothetical protein